MRQIAAYFILAFVGVSIATARSAEEDQPHRTTESDASEVTRPPGSFFASALAAGGNTLVVGEPGYDHGTTKDTGQATVYRITDTEAIRLATLNQSKLVANDRFGMRVAIDENGQIIVVSGAGDYNTGAVSTGAYIFELIQEDRWALWSYRVPNGTAGISMHCGDQVAVANDTVATSCAFVANRVALFDRTLGGLGAWGERLQLTRHPLGQYNYGTALSASGQHFAIGIGCFRMQNDECLGKVDLHRRDKGRANGWGLVSSFDEGPGTDRTDFGHVLSLRGTWLAVAQPHDAFGGPHPVIVYQYSHDRWQKFAELLPHETLRSEFGRTVLVGDDFIAVAGRGGPIGLPVELRAVALYVLSGSSWVYKETLFEEADAVDYGASLAFNGRMLFVGAPGSTKHNGRVFAYLRNSSGSWQLMYNVQ